MQSDGSYSALSPVVHEYIEYKYKHNTIKYNIQNVFLSHSVLVAEIPKFNKAEKNDIMCWLAIYIVISTSISFFFLVF